MSEDDDREALLGLLESHGQQFLQSFDEWESSQRPSKRRKQTSGRQSETKQKADVEDSECESDGDSACEEEWRGFEDEVEDVDNQGDDTYDDGFTSNADGKQPETVVFGEPKSSKSPEGMTKSQVKAFMSSKVSKLRHDGLSQASGANMDDDEHEDERTNLENDALLHKLIHTQLLSTRSSDANLKPAERRRAIEGRVLELASGAKMGRGEQAVRTKEHRKASKSIRLGLERKANERKAEALEEAKNLGNYHKSIKHMYDASSKGASDRRKRDKGLKMGVGHFSDGVLKLSKKDFHSDARHPGTKPPTKTKRKR